MEASLGYITKTLSWKKNKKEKEKGREQRKDWGRAERGTRSNGDKRPQF